MKNVFYRMDQIARGIIGPKIQQSGKFMEKVFTKGVMIWAGIGYNGSTSLFICEQSVDSEYYQKILSDCCFPYHQSDYILMQDNATPHVPASTKLFWNDMVSEFWSGLLAHLTGTQLKTYGVL